MAMHWSEKYETGVVRIDDQHKRLFEWVNKLEAHVKGAQGHLDAEDLLTFLSTFTRTHFMYEEICMMQRKCPAAEVNLQAHKRLLGVIEDFRARLAAGESDREIARQLYIAAEGWLTGHICKVDTQLRHTSAETSRV